MKKFKSSVGAKVTAWILLVFFAFLFFVSVAGFVILINYDSYFDRGRSLRKTVAREIFAFDKRTIDIYSQLVLGGAEDLEEYEFNERYAPFNSNLFFTVKDEEGNVIIDHSDDVDHCERFEYTGEYTVNVDTSEEEFYFDTYEEAVNYANELEKGKEIASSSSSSSISPRSMDKTGLVAFTYDILQEGEKYCLTVYRNVYETQTYTVNAYVRDDFTATDKYYYALTAVRILTYMRFGIIFIGIVSAVMCLFIMIFLCSAAGYKAGQEGIYLASVHRIPLDLYIAFALLCGIIALFVFFEIAMYDSVYSVIAMLIIAFPACAVLLASTVVTFAARVKKGGWWKNTLVYFLLTLLKKMLLFVFKGIKYAVINLPIYWKAFFVFAVLKFAELCFLVMGSDEFLIFWILESGVLALVVIYAVISLRKLQKAAREIAKGDFDYRVNVKYMTPTLKEHGENLNNISKGLKTSLDEQMKSEHMKAELITNVSHDIKTPLTSIVNYVGLLKRDGLSSGSAPEYLDVLERQSVRLKKLTEDLIEASKATSGCIAVNAENTDVNVLLSQASAEYEEKLSAKHLELVMTLPEKTSIIYADGRLVWRVFDNLFNNICKYALEGPRVYLRSDVVRGQAVISFSNISKEQLNISSDELVERFVRGDASRNTEGSGLGLSIAKSLTELQGGTFDIKIDGDLFKAEIAFDIVG
ncbi:MAG: hypothetical protein J6C89_01660 [Clostridia bacterium]|nr:hypothetical protein [Clostridia bacterium]